MNWCHFVNFWCHFINFWGQVRIGDILLIFGAILLIFGATFINSICEGLYADVSRFEEDENVHFERIKEEYLNYKVRNFRNTKYNESMHQTFFGTYLQKVLILI